MQVTEDSLSNFGNLQAFVERQPQFNEAFGCLKKTAEISLVVDGVQGVLKSVDKRVKLLKANPSHADVEFVLSRQAASLLASSKPQSMGELGIEVVKLIASGEVQIRVIGRVFSVLTGGYLTIIKKAGPEFMAFLGSKGFKSVTKITQAIKNMKA
ncbi:MAG: hypothetical protein AAF202_03020 [Pseudomonadota bacterium]